MVSFSSLFVASLTASAVLATPTTAPLIKRTNSKKGIVYSKGNSAKVGLFSDASWAYNWDEILDGPLPDGVEYVPIMWGEKFKDNWEAAVEKALSSGSKRILGFNEPDYPTQANLDVSTAVSLYKQYITQYANRAELISPAVTNGEGEAGLTYMEKFLDRCNGECGISAMAIHYYADDNVSNFQNHVNQAISLAARYGIHKIWITEFQAQVKSDAQVAFINQVVPWLDQQSAVEGYAYYCADGDMTNGDSLTDVGDAYNRAE